MDGESNKYLNYFAPYDFFSMNRPIEGTQKIEIIIILLFYFMGHFFSFSSFKKEYHIILIGNNLISKFFFCP